MTARARPARAPEIPPICTAIAKARVAADLPQEELARRVKVGQSMVARWENRTEPSLDMILVLERAMKLPRGHLLRAAGYVRRSRAGAVPKAISRDARLDARGRRVLLATYRALVTKR